MSRNIFGYGNIDVDQDIAVVSYQKTGCLQSAHIVVSIHTADMFGFPLNSYNGNIAFCQFCRGKSVAQNDQTLNFISQKLIDILLLPFSSVIADKDKKFIAEF